MRHEEAVTDSLSSLAADELHGRVTLPEPAATRPPSRAAANAWALAQATRDPHVVLIGIYIFAPYFVKQVMKDPVAGQALVAHANIIAGWIVALTAPLLGAVVDRLGPRKPGLAVVTLAMALINAMFWFTPPDGSGLPVAAVGALFAGLTITIAYHETFHNALLIPAAGMRGAARASGLALAGGNFVSVTLLILTLFAFALPGRVHWGFLPAAPLFGLDRAMGEPERIVGPILAVALLLGVIPLLRIVPDLPRTGNSLGQAFAKGARDLADLVAQARGNRNALIFLVGRMIYTDGLTGILVFGGLYAAGVMEWGTLEMTGYGIVLSIAAVAGGLLAGRLDDRIGAKRAVFLEILFLIGFQVATLTMGRHQVFGQAWDGPPLWQGAMFTTLPEILFLALGCGTAVCVTAAYASSRTLLTRVAPLDKTGVFFGLYVLSGTATMWLASTLVSIATAVWHTQRAGFAPISALLLVGLLILIPVRERPVAD
jgi:UMF1 family MFS transporter